MSKGTPYVLSDLPESKMSVHFALRVTAHGHRVVPNDFEHYKVKIPHICVLLMLQGRTCHSAVREAVFDIQSC